MKILVYSDASDHSIESKLGMADYSYYFVKKAYLPVLKRIGEVVDIDNPAQQVDDIFNSCRDAGEFCVFLSFTPPQKTMIHSRCPTICVFAWEYATLPQEQWSGEERHDWRLVLGMHGFAITHSNFAVSTVQEAIRPDFPIVSLPAPIWDKVASPRNATATEPSEHTFDLQIKGTIFDTRAIDWNNVERNQSEIFISRHIDQQARNTQNTISVKGVIYTAIFNPNDGRKNWQDLVSAFCWAFQDTENATLILKLTYQDAVFSFALVFEEIQKRLPFRCRIILIHGFLTDESYQQLVKGTHYAVNSSYGEGQCLPLMEFMSAGKPAIAPIHTAMADYVDERNAFIVKSSREWTHWPHDPRSLKRTFRYRINWQSLREGYTESYRVATSEWPRYLAMSEHAKSRLRDHCGEAGIEFRLREFLQLRYQVFKQFDSYFSQREPLPAIATNGKPYSLARYLANRLPPSMRERLRLLKTKLRY